MAPADGGDDFEKISSLLPLRLGPSQPVPPAPVRREASLDFLHDFGGASWVAYAADHLLVVSHIPSPDPQNQDSPTVGPFFQQAIEPPPGSDGDRAAAVRAVAWCPARPSAGELAAARGDCVWLYAPTPGNDPGSFCWRQMVGILQSFTVEAIGWTGTGDGLITAGIDVVLWIRKSTFWEAAWRSRAEVPQSLVSASWFGGGPVATAAGIYAESPFSPSREESSCVLVHQHDGKSGITKVRLCHPEPVCMVQWRPSILSCVKNDDSYPWRDVLLTCCLDGTIRLWSEIDNGRTKKSSKDIHDQKNLRLSFHVISVIEINQCLKGTLGTDISVAWAIEFGGIISRSEGNMHFSLLEGCEHDKIGQCEWLISVGPRSLVTFWAIHCLDDISPLRFPRVTMWKKQNLMDFKEYASCISESSNRRDRPVLLKAVVSRAWQFGPPAVCLLVQLLPNNAFCWSQLYTPTMNGLEGTSLSQNNMDKCLYCVASAVLYQDGHIGKIRQLAVHPYNCEIELAASLDSNGFLLFWSLSTTCNCVLGMQIFVHPPWKLLGRIFLQDLSPDIEYTCLRWAPSILDENRFLLLGHDGGVDCFIIKICGERSNILCQKILTVSFTGHNHVGGPPDRIFATPIASTNGPLFVCNSFLLFAIWTQRFQALSWKVFLHSEDLSRCNCQCDSDAQNVLSMKEGRFLSSFAGRMYEASADLVSSTFPDSQDIYHVTSVAVVPSDNSVLAMQQFASPLSEKFSKSFPYHLATGCSDGTLKLWRVSHSETTTNDKLEFSWELVGAFTAHQGPVSAVSLSRCGGRVATVSMDGINNTTSLHIWESICLIDSGGFLLEDVISFNKPVVTLSWLSIGNGQLLLGVCTPNELRVYSERSTNQIPVKSGKSSEMHIWLCIALSPLTYPVPKDFIWGPKAALILVYEKYFSLFSPWSFGSQKEYHEEQPASFVNGADDSFSCAANSKSDIYATKEFLKNEVVKENGLNACTFDLKQQQYEFDTKSGLHGMLDLADRLRGTLAVYHPAALIQYLYTGNWKRAFVVLKHLVGYIKSTVTSATNLERNNFQKSFRDIPEIHLSSYFVENISKGLHSKGLQWGQATAIGSASLQYQGNLYQFAERSSIAAVPEEASIVTSLKSEIMGFIDVLKTSGDIASMKDIDINKMIAIVELLGEVSDSCCASAYRSLDEPGRRFWVAVRFQRLYLLHKFGRLAAAEEFIVNSSLVAMAFHCDCQDNLFSSIFPTEPSWLEMRNLGVGFWFTDATQLRARMEKLARSQYLKRKDPKDCALLYLALNRVQVLAGLFKVSKDEKDKVLFAFLSRNFQEEKNRAAALKNAYVLMGRHQLELAIAFFLLGCDPSSAVTVCAKNLGDEQLALVICRLLEGYGGPLERQLISNFLLPHAIEKGDYWLSSLLEWTLGNYSRSLKHLLDSHTGSVVHHRAGFSDPNIGQHCVILASKNSLRNSIGDFLASVVSKFALSMAAKALSRCGLPLEALECLSSLSIENKDQCHSYDIGSHEIFHGLLNPLAGRDCNWLVGRVACHLESNAKLNMALLYIGKLLRYHPCYPHANFASSGEPTIHKEVFSHQEESQIEEFSSNLAVAVSMFKHKYFLKANDLAEMIFVFSCNKGLLFLGYQLLQDCMHQGHGLDDHTVDGYMLNSTMSSLLVKGSKEISHIVARHIVACSFADSILKLSSSRGLLHENDCHNLRDFCLKSAIYTLRTLGPLFKLYNNGSFPEGLTLTISNILVLLEYVIYFSSAWLNGNLKSLIVMIRPILNSFASNQLTFEVIACELMKILHQNSDLVVHDSSSDVVRKFTNSNSKEGQDGQSDLLSPSILNDEKWFLIGVCLWMHLSRFAEHQLSKFLVSDRDERENSETDLINLFPLLIARLLMTSLMYVSSSLSKQLASYLRDKALKGLPVVTLCWLKESSRSPESLHSNQEIGAFQFLGNEDQEFMLKILWEISVHPREICAKFVHEKVNCFSYSNQSLPQSWRDIQKDTSAGYENRVSSSNKIEGRISDSFPNDAARSLLRSTVSDTLGVLEPRMKDTNLQKTIPFQNPREVFKRSGELVEAICFNSINEQQVALVSNRKGLLFFDLKIEEPSRKDSEYIWSVCDWPQDGWAGCESTPIPTFVSPGIGLGSKRGAHLGLGGATIGLGSLARPGRDLTGGGAFGIPGYAGIGASGLGWGEQEEFEEYMDPPATVENIRSRALCHHPSKPFFLVGSSNTHVYLWEFGKDRATATYGILPAANGLPPYALASVSALQFDHCGQRFATAALDGTVCTWQLEVGGRSNVQPAESALCFNNHASDVAYLATSGSILAAAGCSTNGVNVIVWDTLAPPATSQASLVCHEGGARSLSVFGNDIGSSSISPLIVTGGKSGDVGLHDFRFIATGRTKRHRHSSEHDLNSSGGNDTTPGTYKSSENVNGMIWHIPKAHLGSVTRISTIPNTSLFLTGSKDGDVKLWDAKRCELVFHWQKLHDRHTFLQPNSRGFGGVVRAAVTDIQVLSQGFLTCGGDGSVKLVHFQKMKQFE